MQEIRFRDTEDRLRTEMVARKHMLSIVGPAMIDCTFCGSRREVICSIADMTAECVYCWYRRRFQELTSPQVFHEVELKEKKVNDCEPKVVVNSIPFDLEDFCKI